MNQVNESHSRASDIWREVASLFRPPSRLPVAEAIRRYMRVPRGANTSGPWESSLTPYMIDPINTLSAREYDAVVFVGPARTGKTEGLIDGWIVYGIICDPADMLVVQMTETKAREHSRTRLSRTFRHSPEVSKRLSPSRNDNNVHDKMFLDGSFLKIGWPSITVFSSSDYRRVALTDYDRFPENVDGEGDAFTLASKRTTTFMSSGMTLVESSPGRDITDTKWRCGGAHEAPPTTGILSLYNRGDRRRWYWPCPHCGEYFQPVMDNMTGYRNNPDFVAAGQAARLMCPHCRGLIAPEQKRELNNQGIWLRDGEVFAQMVSGAGNGLERTAGVPFWLEAMEPDFVPMRSDESAGLNQGVFLDEWGRPKKYLVYKNYPVSGRQSDTKEIVAGKMIHLKFTRRLHQTRGSSMLSGVLMRISALKEYEDAELTAARIAAALGLYIRKGDGQDYEDPGIKETEREVHITPGIIYDDLRKGEDIGMVKSDRPNPNLETFRNGQLRAVAAGSRLSFSSAARNYNGTYSAQRQELVESTDGYLILQDCFIGAVTRPVYRTWLNMVVAAGLLKIPADVEMKTLYNATYSGPVMPWIDPVKEAEAWRIQIRGGAATESDWVRAGGRNPDEVKRRRKAEIDENSRLGLVFDTDPVNDKGGNSAGTERQHQRDTESQHEE